MHGKSRTPFQGSLQLCTSTFQSIQQLSWYIPRLAAGYLTAGEGSKLCHRQVSGLASSHTGVQDRGYLHSVLGKGMEDRERTENVRRKSTTVMQNTFFQMHVAKVKIIPRAPHCYSYKSLVEFQQPWVSVPIYRQNKLKVS